MVAVPFLSFASGTRVSTVFVWIDLHGSGSVANAAFSSSADGLPLGLADEDAPGFLSPPEPESLPESDEQPHDGEDHRDGCAGENASEARG